jgi:outer membrane biosynthesis protein TonB
MSKRKKVTLAVIGSLLLHLVFALSVVGYYAVFPPPPNPPAKEDEKLPELTLVDTPPAQQKRQYVDTDDDQKTDKKPEDSQFESDKDTAAASEKEGKTVPGPLPEQEGKNLEDLMFKNHDFSLDTKGTDFNRQSANGGASAQSTPVPTPTASATPVPSPKPDELAMLMSTPTPTPPPTPQQSTAQQNKQNPGAPQTAYRPQKIVTRMQGNISNRGRSSVGAIGTPQGRFQKAVEDAVGSRWYYYVGQRADLVDIGTVRIDFKITRSGRVKDARIISNSSNQTFGSVSLQSILDASIPPMPPELASLVPESGLEFTFSFTQL